MDVAREPLTQRVIGCAIEVHRTLGPGLLESAYTRCLALELRVSDVPFVQQAALPVLYKGTPLDCGYRVDFIVDGSLIVELKAVDAILPIHQAQRLTYLKLLRVKQGLLINFNVTRLVDGLRSFLI